MKRGGETRPGRVLNEYLAPALLILIAVVQMFSAFANDQTPWKGGGFGMFSTVDSPGARFLKIYLVSENGEEAVRLPPRLSRLRRIIRSAPTQENLDLLVQALNQETWVRAPYPYLFYSAEANAWQQQTAVPGATHKLAAKPFTRSKLPQEPEFPAEFLVAYDSIRVELWKYHYEIEGSTVRATIQSATSAARTEP
ncbi:MAG: hypothetical protein ACE5EU_00135 [Paracoccaceae bacterium]